MADPSIDFDAIANDLRLLPFRGWHDDYPEGGEYFPAIQQIRAEFIEFATLLDELGINGKCLQIGLGMSGAAHLAFASLFREAWTIEDRQENLDRLFLIPGPHNIICGDSKKNETLAQARQAAPYDLLFIDGNHGYRDVAGDYLRYAQLVRIGGIIAFHDAIPEEHEVRLFLGDLQASGVGIKVIGEKLGIAWTLQR